MESFLPFLVTVVCCHLCLISVADESPASRPEPPPAAEEQSRMEHRFRQVLRENPPPAATAPDAVQVHLRRGDARFFLRQFSEAVDEYQAMIRLRPELDASHWQLGIALYFADRPEEAAAQFDRYHTFDDVDRENGIWRFLCHHRAFGVEHAARQLLQYRKDDREPFPAVYQLFDGTLTPDEALRLIPADLSARERDKRLFYTELYIGMLATVRRERAAAELALRKAVSRQWPRTAGYGPHYMWHVARLQLRRLQQQSELTN